jgi:hypothetical protein
VRTVDLILWEDSEDERRAGEYLQAEEELAQVEAELLETRALLGAFVVEHDRLVKPLYAELNGLEAEIADIRAGRVGSAGRREDVGDGGGGSRDRTWRSESGTYSAGPRRAAPQPSADAKKIYRKLARRSHPDLATSDQDRAVREVFMARVNNAYARGDVNALSTLTAEWDGAQPSSGPGGRPTRPTRARWTPSMSVDVLSRLAAAKTELLVLKTTGLGGILFDSAAGDMADALRRLEAVADEVRDRIAERRAALNALLQNTA